MSRKKQLFTDAMAVIGVVLAVLFCGAQISRTLTTTEGVSLAQYSAFTGSMILSLLLAIGARKASPGRIIKQQIAVYSTWSVSGIGLILVVIYVSNYRWSTMDTIIAGSAIAGFILTMGWAVFTRTKIGDPAIKAWNGIFLKSVPQVFLVWLFCSSESASGWSAVAIWTGHASIISRLTPLLLSVRSEGMDRDKKWLLIAEGINEASWVIATVAWVIV